MSSGDKEILIGLAVLLVVIWVLDMIAARVGDRVVAKLPAADQAMLQTRYRLLRRIAVAIILFIGVVVVLISNNSTRAAAQAVLASSAVVGLAFGFAARSTLANFIAGVMIAINQPVRLGDRVAVGTAEGEVEDIGLTYTRLRTADNVRVLIPNEELAASRVTNQTIIDPTSLAQARVLLPLGADSVRVKEVLSELTAVAPGRLLDRPAPIGVSEVTADGAVYSVGVWVADAATAAQTSAWLRERALSRLTDEGIMGRVPEAASE